MRPHVPDAWIDSKRRDPQDGKVGLVGYEFNFNRYFYEYRPPRPLEEIEADIRRVEKEIAAMLEEDARLTPARLRRLRANRTERRLSPLPVSLLRAIHSR